MSHTNQSPNWQPISMLSKIAWAIDGMLESANEQFTNLQQAQTRPHVLDDVTVDRLVTAYTEQQHDLWLYREQLARWQALTLDTAQQAEVARLNGQLAALTERIAATLALAEQIRPHTIDAILKMSDAELALAMLNGKIRPPGAPKKQSS